MSVRVKRPSNGGCYGENPDQRTTDFTILGVLEGAPAPVPESVASSPKLLLGNSHPAHQSALLDAMPSVDLAVADTMGLWIDVARPELESLLSRVHGVVMNEEEAASFTGAPSLVDASHHLLDLGPNFAVVKKGSTAASLLREMACRCSPRGLHWPLKSATQLALATPSSRDDGLPSGLGLPFADRPPQRRRVGDGRRQLYHRRFRHQRFA